jgi:hypothetical protein
MKYTASTQRSDLRQNNTILKDHKKGVRAGTCE